MRWRREGGGGDWAMMRMGKNGLLGMDFRYLAEASLGLVWG